MNVEQGGPDPQAVDAHERLEFIEAQILPPPEGPGTTAEFFDALYTLGSVIVMLPAYLAMALALAVALYIRCAGALLSVR